MQDIATKVEGSQLTATEFNQIPSEIENAITSTGQTLTNADVRQLVKAIAIYAAKGDFYTPTGTADVITLNPVSQMQAPTAYYLGMRIRFIAVADNTGPVTIAVGTLGTVSLYNNEGKELSTGEITNGIEYSATYDGSAFRLFAAGSGGGAALPLFYHTWQDHKLTDASYVRADTFSWQDGDIYYTAYNELVNEKALTVETSTETIAGIQITYYRTPKNYKIVLADQADFVSLVYQSTGAAWYYILDEENKRFKLPRNSRYESGTKTEYAGDFGAESLPNITGSTGNSVQFAVTTFEFDAEGAIFRTVETTSIAGASGRHYTKATVGLDASRSSSTYQDNAKVNPEHVTQYLYFYVGNTKRKETEINIGAITEALNGKVDIDANNLSNEGKSLISGLGMPSSRYEDLTLGASGTLYTAPANGYITLLKVAGAANKIIRMVNTTGGYIVNSTMAYSSASETGVFMPCKKGDNVSVHYDVSGATRTFRFVYAEGEE